ncbi:MAG: LmeA family phospholipid-binding protein [Fusobacterium sp.]|nr:LmeA family phospholipid-binding protein [Fusobacterium sp.]
MKKFLTLLLIFCAQTAFTTELCPTTYELTSGWQKFASRASGSNFIHTTILEHYLEKQISEHLGGKFDIKIDSFSTPDLKEGKFRSVKATGENIVIDKVSVSKATINSICTFNQIEKAENHQYRFVTDFPADLTVELTAADLNKITQTTDYKKMLREINGSLMGFLKIDGITFDIKNNKLWYNLTFSTPFSPKKQSVKVGTGLSLKNNDISVENLETSGKSAILKILSMSDALNYVNPLDFSVKILENSRINADVKEVSINEDRIILKAFINIRK